MCGCFVSYILMEGDFLNNTYFNKDIFPQKSFNQDVLKGMPNNDYMLENSNFFSILRFNRGKKVHIFMSFPNSSSSDFDGIIESMGNDYIIISEPSTGKWHMLFLNYIDFITFDESINYGHDYN